MKLIIFTKDNTEVKKTLLLENILLNIKKGNAVFIGTDKQVNELTDIIDSHKPTKSSEEENA